MPGFLAAAGYDGTEKIDLGHGYWAEVKRCLNTTEMGMVENVMGGGRQTIDVSQGGKRFAELNIRASRVEMVVQSIVSWNVDDDSGQPWPLDGVPDPKSGNIHYPPGCLRRQSVAKLPGPVFDQIWKVCDDLNSPLAGQAAAGFPGQPVSSDPDGGDGTAGAAAVPDGAGVLDAAGLDEGDPGDPAA